MHLHELLGWAGPMTHRQFVAWQEWLAAQWNHPSRTDHYLMQIAQSVIAANSKDPGRVRMDKLRLQFKTDRPLSPEDEALARKQAAMSSQQAWLGAFGGKVRIMRDGKLVDPAGDKKPERILGKPVKLMRKRGERR